MINCLLKLSGEVETDFFYQQLKLEDYDIQLTAAKALANLGEKAEQKLEELMELESRSLRSGRDDFHNNPNDLQETELVKIIKHAKEWKQH